MRREKNKKDVSHKFAKFFISHGRAPLRARMTLSGGCLIIHPPAQDPRQEVASPKKQAHHWPGCLQDTEWRLPFRRSAMQVVRGGYTGKIVAADAAHDIPCASASYASVQAVCYFALFICFWSPPSPRSHHVFARPRMAPLRVSPPKAEANGHLIATFGK